MIKQNYKSSKYIEGLVSVVIPTYNREKTLSASIKSVEDQTYDHLEILVVDDGSTDNTEELVQQMASADNRITYMKNSGDKGASGARNIGIAASNGEYVAFNDSDDYFLNDKIRKQIIEIEDAEFCYGRFKKIMSGAGYIVPPYQYKKEGISGEIYRQLLHDNLIGCPTLMVRHDFLDKTGVFDTSFPALEDYDMSLRLAKSGRAAFVDDVILESGYSEVSLSTSAGNFVTASLMLLQKYLPDIVTAGELDYKVNVILKSAEYCGVKEKAARIISQILSQYEETVRAE